MNRFLNAILLFLVSAAVYGQDTALVKKAQAGDAEAQYRLAREYLPTTNSKSEEGFQWLIKAGENGNVSAQNKLYLGYRNGWYGANKDEDQYFYWLNKFAANSSTDKYEATDIAFAQYELADIYRWGQLGVKKDISKALKWYMISAEVVSCASYALGLYYEDIDKEKAIYWFKKGMDKRWADHKEEDKACSDQLLKLGVIYHPANPHQSSTASSTPSSKSSTPTTSTPSGNTLKAYTEFVPMQVWQSCYACNGSGKCHVCYGSGTNFNGNTCYLCNGWGVCTDCAGHGGQNVIQQVPQTVYR